MKPRRGKILFTIAMGLFGLSQAAIAQRVSTANMFASDACANGNLSGAVTVRALERGNPLLSICDGHALSNLSVAGQAQPVSMVSADFDGDGVPDLVTGFSTGNGGEITIHRGNVNALWPYGAALRNGPPPAFLPNPRSFTVPESPDFLVTGDFDADGHWDIITAQRGSSVLYFLKGDGRGGFRAAQRISVCGNVTAMIAGEINRADGLADLIVAVNSASGARALVYESPTGALTASPEIFKLSKPATALALSKFNGNAMNDLAVASGNQLVLIHARDRKLSMTEAQRSVVAPAKVTVQNLSYAIQALVAGDFTGTGAGIAALGDDGKIHTLEHAVEPGSLAARMASDANFRPTMQLAKPDKDGNPIILGGSISPSVSARFAAVRESVKAASSSTEWTERSATALPPGFAQTHPHLIAGRVTGSMQEDLIAVDSGNSKVHVLSTIAGKHHVSALSREAIGSSPAPMKLIASLEAASAPAAVLPMRLSRSGLSGLVVLQAGQAEPTVMPQDTPPANTFVVTNTSDAIIPVVPEVTGPVGSLRAALYNASQATGTSSIVFNIPTTDPGYNPTTGTFLIQPLSEAGPGDFNDFALNPNNATVIIDGYTQPGASPNTLANGDNAKLLIQIDGGKATTPGGSGLTPFDDVGSVYRGMVFTGWVNPDIATTSSGSTASGAEGMEAHGVQDFIEGNFFGTDPTGKVAAPNRIGIFTDGGPGLGSTAGGNIIGGTTPQARNILSGNNNSGVLFLSTAFEAQLQGNFIGLDVTGTAIVSNLLEADRSNSFDGTGLNGATITIGGTLPGTANVIAGNGTNVDINDLTNGGQAADSIVQGNLIGTDATGKVGIPSQGYGVSILNNPIDMLIGGTTPAARNVISGNLAGVYVFDNSFDNIVEGNYIGVDITGTKAVPNLEQGFITGATVSTMIPAGDTTIGGSVAGAGNVISGNTMDGIQIAGTSLGPTGQDTTDQGNFILGNFIGTDATGKISIPNGGNGVDLISSATNNIIGGSAPGSGNLIANNAQNGVLIDPGTGSGNNTIANIIQSNSGAGVRINTGNGNRISQNSIFGNGDLGINLQNAGANLNTACNASNTGANNLQNAPSLTSGSGTAFITATATDPNGNTSEFSNAVNESVSGSVVDLLGNFNSTPNTTYTIEFFSSTAADPSGFGEGQTYLTSTTVTTGTNCTTAISDPVDTAKADLSVTLSSDTTVFVVGPDFGQYFFTATVTNNGAATAHNVVLTDTLPAGLVISNAYCDVGPCQTPASSSLGDCTVSDSKVTCNLGIMAPGATAQATIPVQATGVGNLIDTATVTATEADPNLANNTASLTEAVDYNFPFIDHLDPASALTQTSGNLPMTVYGNGFLPTTAIAFNGTPVTTTGYLDNQVCGLPFNPGFCTGIQVSVPASLLGTAGTATVTATNPDPGPDGEPNEPSSFSFTIASSCSFTVENEISFDFGLDGNLPNAGTNLIAEEVTVAANVPTCTWTATSSVPWAVILDSSSATGSGAVDVAIAPNSDPATRTGSVTVAGQTFTFGQDGGAACTYTFSPTSSSFAFAGGTGSIPVTSGCFGYNIVPYASWITVPENVSSLVDNGTTSYTVAANPGAPRTGTIAIGGAVFTVTQSAPSCYYTLSTTSALVPVGGATGTIGVTASSPSCAWTAKSSNSSLLSVTAGASGTGNGTVTYSAPVNAEGPQTATLTIGDATGYSVFTENQASAFTCTFNITPASVSATSNGLSNYFVVNASYGFCKWTATSSDPTSLVVDDVSGQGILSTSGSATGSGAVYFRVAQNSTGAPRVLTITAGCQTFTVNQDGGAASNPVPAITSLLPATATAGSGALTLTLNGSNFVNGATVNFNGVARATTFVNANQVTAAILATDVASVGTPLVTVTNPSPGGGASNPLTFTITAATNGTPAITSLQPTGVTAGSGAFTLTVNGSGFVSGATVNFNGNARATTFVSATKVTAAILATDVANTGNPSVTVTNPSPGGGTSNAITFSVAASNNPAPAITTLQPASASAGSSGFTLTVTGSSFVSGAVVNFNGAPKATTFVSATTVTAAILASDVAIAGTPSVTVTNPAPGGGTSNALTFTINNLTPTVTSLQPSSVAAGAAAFTLTVTGNGFIPASVVTFNGNAKATTYVSGTQLSAAILATDVAKAGSASVSVTNPAPGGGSATAVNFTITAAAGPQASLSPSTLAFPSTTEGASAAAQTIMLSNTGNATLNISGITIGGANPSAFSQTNTCGTSLASGTNCSILVTFSPASIASFAATLSVADNATGSPQTVALSGTGVAPPAPIVSLTPASLSFTAQTGATSAAQTATLKNTGNAALSISGITIGGADSTDFAQTNTCGESVAAGANCSISITFTPASAASFAATLSVADNASGSPHTVSLTGTGTVPPPPTFTITSSTASQTVQPGGSAQYSLTVTAQNGTLPNPVTFAVSGLPTGATGTFSPASVSPGSTSATSQLTIQTPAPATTTAGVGSGWRLAATILPLFGLLFGVRRFRKRWVTIAVLLFASLGALTALSGCGGGFGLVTSTSYSITVTGTSGAIQKTTTVQLIVQ